MCNHFTSDEIVRTANGRVWELVPGSMLLEGLQRHPLGVPLSLDTKVKFDVLKLDFHLHAVPPQKLLKRLPIDVSPLVALCDKHRDHIDVADIWTDDFFYLELLSLEGTLKPLFWGQVEHMLDPMQLQKRARELRETGDVGRDGRGASRKAWADLGEPLITEGVVTPHREGPWLAHLGHRDFPVMRWSTDDGEQWDDDHPGDGMFAAGLYWKREPFYAYRQAMDILWDSMVKELWDSSVFCPRPINIHEKAKWSKHARRFAISYRKYTDQQSRKAKFTDFVLSRWPKMEVAVIAREARERKLWPYGTPRGEDKPGYDPHEACRQAVYRVLKASRRKHL